MSLKLFFKLQIYTIMFATLVAPLSYAHDETSDADPYEQALRYGTLLEKISQMAPELNGRGPQAAVPFVRIKGQDYYLNNSFYKITEEILNLYTLEIQSVCPKCEIPSAEEMNEQARALVAKGWLGNLGEKSSRVLLGRYGSEFVDLGARYGPTAGLLKVAGELAEDALLVVFKMPGAHFLCDVITMAIAYHSGRVLTLYRTFANAKGLGRNGFAQWIRLVTTSYVVSRALKKIRLDVGPMEVDPRLFEGKGFDDTRKEWLSHEISDEKSYRRFFIKISTLLKSNQVELNSLETKSESLDGRAKKRVLKKISKLKNEASKLTQVSRKVFEGRRLGLSLYLLKRKRLMTLYSSEPELNKFLKGSKAWMIPLTATVLEPGLRFSSLATEPQMKEFVTRISQNQNTLIHDGPNDLLLEEAKANGLGAETVSGVFADIDFIFDAKASRRQKYLQVTFMQSFLGDFMGSLAKSYTGLIRSELLEKNASLATTKATLGLQWRVGKLTYYSNLFSDYLKSVALVRGKGVLIHEADFAKDYYMRLIESYEILGKLKTIPEPSELKLVKQQLDAKIQELKAHQFWIEKRATVAILPIRAFLASTLGFGNKQWFRRGLRCEQLYY